MSQMLDLGAPPIACYVVTAWFGGYRHTHKAIDDALGYASVLRHVLAYPDAPSDKSLERTRER